MRDIQLYLTSVYNTNEGYIPDKPELLEAFVYLRSFSPNNSGVNNFMQHMAQRSENDYIWPGWFS